MEGIEKEHWVQLCHRAEVEQDPDKLIALAKEIIELLEKKERQLRNASQEIPTNNER
jgi:hypothetical protein